MTTQTTNLLFQTTGASAGAPRGANPDRLADSARGNGAFGATLSRELAARQQAPQPQPQTPAAQQPKPAAQQQSTPKAADKPANREPVREQANKAGARPAGPDGEAKTTKPASAEGKEEAETAQGAAEGAAEAAAAATTPVTDMLAFMASLTRPAAADAAAVSPDAAAAGDLQSTALEGALERMTGAAGSTGADAAAGAAAVTDQLGKGVSLAAGVQRAPSDPNASQAQAGALPEGLQDAAQFQTQLRESQQQVATRIEDAPAPLAQLQAQAARMADAVGNPAAVPGDRIPARMGSQAWDNQVSQRIVYMVGKEQAATLTLNPPDLGPVQIVLNVSNDQASVAFSAEQLEVRQALENALPRLREMMSESGIALGNATVDAGARQQQDCERQAPGGANANGSLAGNGTGGEGEAAVNEAAPRTRTVGLGERGMVDLFA
ncbi:flagellar hook-length control protein FliK [Massilia sp. UYP11]|uniref:flagellar hook-length control protein FliK n=1 Tax=Massilia sp. UYP11 TaxID=1756385 RepID=UPI003D245B2B